MDINSPVGIIPKIGPKYKFLLNKLDINTIGDLLYHFPFRYDDYSQIKTIGSLNENEIVTIKATLLKVDNIFTRNGKRLTRAKVSDDTGTADIIWFNQHYLKSTLSLNTQYNWSGKVAKIGNKMGLISPSFEQTDKTSLNTGRLVPVYTETAGITSKYLRSRINDVVSLIGDKLQVVEFIPSETLIKNKLLKIDSAFKKIHFPENTSEADTARKRFGFEEMFLELLRVEGKKDIWVNKYKSMQIQTDEKLLAKFIKSLLFTLTDSQQQAITQILSDLAQNHPMNRLLEGDVGTGKTVVAAIASYICIQNGYKVLYMAPTEILANQHYQTFVKFIGTENVGLLTSSSKDNTDKNILIGTHALLFNQEILDKVALVIVDEQHRFGVKQRATLLDIRNGSVKPHLLSMTATPIPRTLALILYGDLSISSLTTPPNKDKKITTKVVTADKREEVFDWIAKQDEQVFIVCPFIEISDTEDLANIKAASAEFEKLKNGVFANTTVGLLHGKLKSAEKEKILESFRQGEIKVLVSTPVIEVGVDIPEATIMVIESAERYGLASLHQLRGRVGRGAKEGFCFIFTSSGASGSYNRLKHLETVSSGLELANIDLQIRGQGDLYGTMQSGFKRFKVADFTDVELIQKAKTEAQEIFPRLSEFPLLKEKIENTGGLYGANN